MNLFSFTNLRVLSVRSNNLRELPPAINGLENLEDLNIACNKLSILPAELMSLFRRKLRTLRAHPNPWLIRHEEDALPHTPDESILDAEKIFARRLGRRLQHYFTADGSRREEPVPVQLGAPRLLTMAALVLYRRDDFADTVKSATEYLSETLAHTLSNALRNKGRGGIRCTGPEMNCGRELVVPHTQWVEWYTFRWGETEVLSDLPFARHRCSDCAALSAVVHDNESVQGG